MMILSIRYCRKGTCSFSFNH
uniref:Uncharacterized protein n=1 Tax=Rhizophora mucronata TaxID=61149 RepID=A0A2P2QT92_RHIMU